MSGWPQDAYYFMRAKLHDPTVLLGVGRKNKWQGGILSLTYVGDFLNSIIRSIESRRTTFVTGGTEESELILIKARNVPQIVRDYLKGSVGFLNIEVKDDDTIALLVVSTGVQCKNTSAIFWVHFHFE